MSKDQFLNILDFGNSSIRFSIFDKKLDNYFSEIIDLKNEKYNLNDFRLISELIKKGEKKISSHIENVILMIDSSDLLTIDLSYYKILDVKDNIEKVYNDVLKEVTQIVVSNYQNYTIIHSILNKCIIDKIEFTVIPKEKKKIKNINVDLKFICFPKLFIQNLKNKFNENNINILNIFCTSYVKTFFYIKKLNIKNISFLEIGWERTTLINYKDGLLKSINSIAIGGFHITKDISKIFKISLNDAEKIKKSFNKSDTEFSYKDENVETYLKFDEIINKNISINKLKQVILYRVQEIIDLIYVKSDAEITKNYLKKNKLFLTGQGSILFNNNSFHIEDKFEFESINFYNETNTEICKSGIFYYENNIQFPNIIQKKQGIFERFFNFFSK